jgi:hypothetical protein
MGNHPVPFPSSKYQLTSFQNLLALEASNNWVVLFRVYNFLQEGPIGALCDHR